MNAKSERRTPAETLGIPASKMARVTGLNDRRFQTLMAASSLGSPEARAHQDLVPEELTRRLMRQAKDFQNSTEDELPWDRPSRTTNPKRVPTGSPRPSHREQFKRWSRRYVARLAVIEGILGGFAAILAMLVSTTLHSYWPLGLLGSLVWPVSVFLAGGYRRTRIGIGSNEARAVLKAGVGVVVAGAVLAGLMGPQSVLTLIVVSVPFVVLLSLTSRLCNRRHLHRLQRTGKRLRRVVVVGASSSALEFRDRLTFAPESGMEIVGMCVPAMELPRAIGSGLPVMGDLSDVARVAAEYQADAVAVVSDDSTRTNYLRELAWSLEGTGVELLVDPGFIEVTGPRIHIRPLTGMPLLEMDEPHFTGWRRVLKRTLDLVITSTGLVVVSPVMAALAIAIKVQDRGPILFKQTRVGRSGAPFTMYKFRSMVIDAEARKHALIEANTGKGGLFKLSDDPRITPLGKFMRNYSLDELPQLFNVLNGTMSLVGPRPHLAHELSQMPNEAWRRALVTPGLTGLWQTSGRSNLIGDDALRLDLRYVENWHRYP